jgi:hypothetical protein
MALKPNKNDRKLFLSLAECRVLTLSQVAAIQRKSKQVTRRRLRALEQAGLILSRTQGFGRFRGRPEKLFSLAEKGTHFLDLKGPHFKNVIQRLDEENIRSLDHQLLVNWFQIHLQHMEHKFIPLSIQFLSPTSPLLKRDHNNRPFIFERLPADNKSGGPKGFTPDGVFSISHNERNKNLLFFLEVDQGTESIASVKRNKGDIRQKIINYQRYFRSGRYKRYENTWGCSFNGFRLLFLTNTSNRLTALCRLVRDMPPSDFIWITDQERMFAQGLSDAIWFRGGRPDTSPESILGTAMACLAPILPLKE